MICRDFQLKTEEILWVENLPEDPHRFYAAAFTNRPYMGAGSYDSVAWRPV